MLPIHFKVCVPNQTQQYFGSSVTWLTLACSQIGQRLCPKAEKCFLCRKDSEVGNQKGRSESIDSVN